MPASPLPTRVIRALETLNIDDNYSRAPSADAVYLYQLIAAQKHGVYEPFDEEAQALNAWLLEARAGKRLVEEAWDAFMRVPDQRRRFFGKRAKR